MRHTKLFIGFAIVVGIAAIAIVPRAQEQRSALKAALGDAQFVTCGLDKLTSTEQEALTRLITTGPTISFTQSAAERYLEREGWRPVRVLGATPSPNLINELYAVVWDHYEIYSLDVFGSAELPEPGIYLAKNTLSSWDILYPDGSKVSFTAR